MMINSLALAERAAGELRRGVPIIIASDVEKFLVLAAESVDDALLQQLRAVTLAPRLLITDYRARFLHIPNYTGQICQIAMSSQMPAKMIHAIADPSRDLDNFLQGPLRSLRDGQDYTDIGKEAMALVARARLLPCLVVGKIQKGQDLQCQDLVSIALGLARQAEECEQLSLETSPFVHLPIQQAADARLIGFRARYGVDEHYALTIGEPFGEEAVGVRIHSCCFTGDVLGSRKCDCGPQLKRALTWMAENKGGVLLYLFQEGRGIGLFNKIRAYHLQDQGFDTFTANEKMGFSADLRNFAVAAEMLRILGRHQIRLLTNNHDKAQALRQFGIVVKAIIPLRAGENIHNQRYLRDKAQRH